MKKSVRAAATAMLSIGLIGLGAASDIQAQATPFPSYPCNPGDNWNPGNGPYCNGPGPGPGWGPGDNGNGPGGFGPGDGNGGGGHGGGDGGGGHGGGGGGGGGH